MSCVLKITVPDAVDMDTVARQLGNFFPRLMMDYAQTMAGSLAERAPPPAMRDMGRSDLSELGKAMGGKTKGMGGKTLTVEHRAKMSAAHMGKTLSVEHRAKMSAAHMGKTLSVEHRAKLSAAKMGKKRGPNKKTGEGKHGNKGRKFTTEEERGL